MKILFNLVGAVVLFPLITLLGVNMVTHGVTALGVISAGLSSGVWFACFVGLVGDPRIYGIKRISTVILLMLSLSACVHAQAETSKLDEARMEMAADIGVPYSMTQERTTYLLTTHDWVTLDESTGIVLVDMIYTSAAYMYFEEKRLWIMVGSITKVEK